MDAIIDYRGKTPRKTVSGIPLITAKIVKSGRIQVPSEFISEDDYDSWMTRGLPRAGDVVVTTEAPLGEVAQLNGEKIALAQRIILLRGKPDVLDNTFLKFLLQAPRVQSSLPAGAEDELVFRCPDESANAATVKLVVQLPVDHPIASVKVRPIHGWRSRVTMRKLTVPITTDDGVVVAAVDTITWSGGRIEPGEYQDFAILAGPIPSGAKELPFKAIQTYSNGEVVRWIERRGPGEAEPAHPAPVLHVR